MVSQQCAGAPVLEQSSRAHTVTSSRTGTHSRVYGSPFTNTEGTAFLEGMAKWPREVRAHRLCVSSREE